MKALKASLLLACASLACDPLTTSGDPLPPCGPLEARSVQSADDDDDGSTEPDDQALDDLLRRYARTLSKIPVMSHPELVATCRRIEQVESELAQLVNGFGFAAKEYLARAETLLNKAPQKTRGRAKQASAGAPATADVNSHRRLMGEVHRADVNADKAFEHLRCATDLELRRTWETRLAEANAGLQAQLPHFGFGPDFIIRLARMAVGIEGEMRREASLLNARPAAAGARLHALEQRARMQTEDFLPACERVGRLLAEREDARNEIVVGNLRLVVFIAARRAHHGLPLMDVIQEGNLGLIKAVDRFDYRRGHRFSTYARWWIEEMITQSIASQSKTIPVPAHQILSFSRVLSAQSRLAERLGRKPELNELAMELQMRPRRVGAILHYAWNLVSLHTPIGNGDSQLGDLIVDAESVDPGAETDRRATYERLHGLLADLDKRERRVLELRFGFNEQNVHTLAEIGKRYRLTRERIRQIEVAALRKLRHPERLRKLIDSTA